MNSRCVVECGDTPTSWVTIPISAPTLPLHSLQSGKLKSLMILAVYLECLHLPCFALIYMYITIVNLDHGLWTGPWTELWTELWTDS